LFWTVSFDNTIILYGYKFKSTFQHSLHRSPGYPQSWCNLPCWLTVASLQSHSDSVHALQTQAGHVSFPTSDHHYWTSYKATELFGMKAFVAWPHNFLF
jgi:hypothetical protein